MPKIHFFMAKGCLRKSGKNGNEKSNRKSKIHFQFSLILYGEVKPNDFTIFYMHKT